jgi:DNA-binding GntR family transcriptional regulator
MSAAQKARIKATTPLPEFDAVLPMTRRAQVAETLRNFVLSGRLAPGTQLVESKLASGFGVSRGSIREAIWELIDQGLLVNRPYAGTFVVSLDEKTMIEVFSLRGAIERYCFTQLWPKRNQAFRKEFTARHRLLVKTIRAQERFVAIEAEMHFHSFPYEFSGNQTLLEVWHQLSDKIQLGFAMSQVIVRSVDFIGASERYVQTALGDDLQKMLREIDLHLELGVIAVKKLMTENAGMAREPHR